MTGLFSNRVRLSVAAVVAAMGYALLPSPASAASAQVKSSGDDEVFAEYVAGPGEANVVTGSQEGGGVVIRDPGAVIAAGAGCVGRGAGVVFCEVRYGIVFVETGDRADRLVRADSVRYVKLGAGDDELVDPSPADVDGGEGNDRLPASCGALRAGGAGDDLLIGSACDDGLGGGPGTDVLLGNGGNDTLSDGDESAGAVVGSPDRFDGGAGSDTVVYASRRRPLLVDLGRSAPQGSPGENDSFFSVENVFGGSGDDRLTGTDRANQIGGSDGNDVISGLDGDDELVGGAGRDSVNGGAGRDAIDLASTGFNAASFSVTDDGLDVAGERASCGTGRDSIRARRDRIAPDCERVDGIGYPRRRGRRAVIALPCDRHLRYRGKCRVRATLKGTRGACPGAAPRNRRVLRRATLRRAGRRGFALPRGCRAGSYDVRISYGTDIHISRFTATI